MYFEPPPLVDQLIDEVMQMPGALPLLSFTLSELYLKYVKSVREGKRNNRAITQEDYEELGGVARSLTQRADWEYDELVKVDPAYKQTVRHVMLRMMAVGGGELARRRVLCTELEYPEPENARIKEVIERFVAARLLVKGRDIENHEYVEPAHDVLVRGWQKLLNWKQQEQETLILQRRLTPAALEWKSQQQAKFLWNADPRLDLLKQVLNSSHNWFNKLEAEFVQQSIKQKRKNAIRLWTSVTGAFVVLSGATLIAINNYIDAQNELLESNSSLAESLLASGRELEALEQGVKTGKQLKNFSFPTREETKIRVVTTLQQVLYGIRERNRWEGDDTSVMAVSFSPDTKTIATAGRDGSIKFWQYNGKPIQAPLKSHNGPVLRISFSADGQILTSVGVDQTIKLWRRQQNEPFAPFKSIKDKDAILTSGISPDKKIIATADKNNRVKLWHWNGKLLINFVNKHGAQVNDLSFSPDGQILASASADKTIKIWRVKDGKLLKTIREENKVFAVRFVDNQRIVSGSADGIIKLWNLNSKQNRSFSGHTDAVKRLAMSSDGKSIASASLDRTVKLWRVKDGELLHTFTGHDNIVTDTSFSPDDKMLASASMDGTVRIWNIDSIMPPVQGSSVSFSQDKMVSAGEDGIIKLWQQDGKPLWTFPGDKHINRVSFSPDGQVIATSADKTVKLWHLHGTLIKTLYLKNSVTSISFSPNGETIAISSADKKVSLFRRLNWTLIKVLPYKSSITRVSFSPDGNIIAIASTDHTVQLWHSDGTITPLKGHTAAVSDVSFSPNGKVIASDSEDQTVRLWDLNGQLIVPPLTEHTGKVYRVKFSSNGLILASTSEDKTIKLWSLKGELLQTLQGHDASVLDVSWSPDGKTMATADFDEKVILWNLNLNYLLQHSCDWLHDYLTPYKDTRMNLCKFKELNNV